ncbi:MAG: hypothetical protein ACSHX7_05970 [Luteolibacter sp.]
MRKQPILLNALTFPWRGNAKWLFLWLVILSCASYITAISPRMVLPAVFRIGLPNLSIVLMIFLIYFIQNTLDTDDSSPSIGQFIIAKISGSYLMMSNARLVGIIF